ncbi:MAG: hypothetical protein ACJAT4_001556 [Granulosicoccus sp.]|jgi:hypothetical protein
MDNYDLRVYNVMGRIILNQHLGKFDSSFHLEWNVS